MDVDFDDDDEEELRWRETSPSFACDDLRETWLAFGRGWGQSCVVCCALANGYVPRENYARRAGAELNILSCSPHKLDDLFLEAVGLHYRPHPTCSMLHELMQLRAGMQLGC
jgi:hypothetical protein